MPNYGTGIPPAGPSSAQLDITAATTLKASNGWAFEITCTVAGSTPGGLYNLATTAGTSASTLIASIPNTVGVIPLNAWPCSAGITIVPGTGQTLAISYF